MTENAQRPRIGFLGSGPQEVQLLLELRAGEAVDVVGVYDATPGSPGLAMAELVGVPSGSDTTALERLRGAEFIVLPQDRLRAQEAIRWVAGLRAELVPLAEARRRWAALRAVRPPTGDPSAAERTLAEAVDASARLQDRADLADWILNVAMRTVGANGGSIQVLVPETSELYLLAARGLSQRLVRFGRHRLGDGISGLVAATGSAQLLHGARGGLQERERGDIQASISLPLEEGGRLVGVLNVSSTVGGKRFGEEHLRMLERLAPRMTRLLCDAAELDPGTPRLDVPRVLRRSEAAGVDLPGRLRALCDHAGTALGADSVELYLATEDGDWLRVHGPGPQASREVPPARRAEIDAVLAERRWVHITDGGVEGGEDAVAAAIDRALDPDVPHRSRLACPLEGIEQLGVLVLEFASLDAADRCLRRSAVAVGQLAFGVDALLREQRQNRRLRGYAALARSLQHLVDVRDNAALDRTLAEEAAKLTGARVAFVRRVDEETRTFSRPAVYGVPQESPESWRELDARVTARTLQARSSEITTAVDDTDVESPLEPVQVSHLSVLFEHEERIVAIVNVYDKQPRDPVEARAFGTDDRQLLETLALVAARLAVRAAPPRRPAPGPGTGEAAPAGEPVARAGAAPTRVELPVRRPETAPAEGPPPRAPEEPRADATPARDDAAARAPAAPVRGEPGSVGAESPPDESLSMRLQSALADMQIAQRGIGVWVLEFHGLSRLGELGIEARRRLAGMVRLGLRTEDVVGWTADEVLTIVGIGVPPQGRKLEIRLTELVRPLLARLSRSVETGIDLRIGSSTYPEDGSDAESLLAAAAERVH